MKKALLTIFASLAAGCSSELETGYKPEKLGVTSEQRRAYYAPQFSPESMGAAEAGRSGQTKIRRPANY